MNDSVDPWETELVGDMGLTSFLRRLVGVISGTDASDCCDASEPRRDSTPALLDLRGGTSRSTPSAVTGLLLVLFPTTGECEYNPNGDRGCERNGDRGVNGGGEVGLNGGELVGLEAAESPPIFSSSSSPYPFGFTRNGFRTEAPNPPGPALCTGSVNVMVGTGFLFTRRLPSFRGLGGTGRLFISSDPVPLSSLCRLPLGIPADHEFDSLPLRKDAPSSCSSPGDQDECFAPRSSLSMTTSKFGIIRRGLSPFPALASEGYIGFSGYRICISSRVGESDTIFPGARVGIRSRRGSGINQSLDLQFLVTQPELMLSCAHTSAPH
jgi:hypothetical protein